MIFKISDRFGRSQDVADCVDSVSAQTFQFHDAEIKKPLLVGFTKPRSDASTERSTAL